MHLGAIAKQLARAGSRGQILPLAAVSFVVLFGAGALAVDVGAWRHQQRLEQSAADSAAIAAASEMAYLGSTDYKAAASADAASNGFTNGVATASVAVNNPPQSGAYVNDNNAVEVVITKSKPAFFVGINQPIQARAVARVSTGVGPACIVALNGDITLNGGGGGGVTAPKCGVYTNQDLVVKGSNAQITAPTIGYAGSGPSNPNPSQYPLGLPQKSLPIADPCLSIPSCMNLVNLPSTQLHTGCLPQPPPNPIPAGEYCSPLTLNGSSTFSPGLVVLDQGMSVSGNGTLSGTGVTIYNGGTSSFTGSGISFSGNVNINITAPTTGPYAGMVFFQPPSNTAQFTDNGRAGTDNFQGGMYLPTAPFVLDGNIPSASILVTKSITVNGGGLGDSANAGGKPGPLTQQLPVLVE